MNRRKALENLRVVLVGTLYGGNVGSACRAMANCGVRELRLVAPELLDLAERGPVALVFGREDKGLLNEELLLCTHVVQIPASPDYPSYNLAQSVLLLCHELYRAAAGPARNRELESSPPATADLRGRMLAKLRAHLLATGFMQEDNADHMMEGFGRVFARGVRTEADAKLVMGAVQQAGWALDAAKRRG